MKFVVCTPSLLSKNELQHLTRRYTTEISIVIGPDVDIPAPDMGTTPEIMAWLMDTYSMHKGRTVPAVVTGKPIAVGGSEGRNEATGLGVTIVASEAAAKLGTSLVGARVVIQGFGNVGAATAKFMHKAGAKVVGISDASGGFYNESGINIEKALAYAKANSSLTGLPEAQPITNEELLELPVIS
jgi:glutamate dehydrogenase (NAD(P)+)